MANTGNSDQWYFTKEQLENTPSRKCGFDAYKELQYRQQAANFIQDMGQRLQVSQLCINTAIVYMHRFYVFHSFTNFPWHQMAAAALFLAAKVEEQPRKLEYVIRVANICKNPRDRNFDINSERYIAQSQDLVFNENVLLQTLGFDVAIDHPHTYVVRCCHLVRASKDLAQTSYFMASNSLHLTTMCIQYKPTVVACFCILLACKWSSWEIPLSNEKKEWYTYVDPSVTAELLQQLTSEFLVIFENCPSRLKEKIMAKQESSNSPFEQDKKPESGSQRSLEYKGDDPHKHRPSRPPEAGSSGHRSQEQREREYKERKEKERIAHMSGITLNHQPHHHRPDRPPSDPTKLKPHSRPPSSGPPFPATSRSEPRDILREASKDSPFGIPAIRDPAREHVKEPYAARSDKEVPKRDPLLKSNVQTDPNSLTNFTDVRQQRMDPSRSRIDPSKSASKQDMMRRYEEQKLPHIKTETDNIKKHLSSSFDKNSAYLKSSSSSTSQKVKSPFSLDSKSVPKISSSQPNAPIKPQFNGNTNGSYNKPVCQEADIKVKTEPHPIKEEIPTPPVIKRPSLFSPEQTPQLQQIQIKTEPLAKAPSLTSLTALSPINSPPSVPSMRNRNYSSSSEPELRPTMKKIDQVEGFENLMRDSTIGMANMHNAADGVSENQVQETSPKYEVKSENVSAVKEHATNSQNLIVNGLETNPILISNLLKEVATTSHLPGVATTSVKQEPIEPIQDPIVVPPLENSEREHRHHKSKKKKEKHKHKDKDKSKDEKEKKKKHKDKDRERHKHRERNEEAPSHPMMSEPIKIKIHKDKIQPLNQLKIKIPKDKIKTEGIMDSLSLPQPSSGGLKIKIPKDMITNCGTSSSSLSSFNMSLSNSSSSRKRERDRTSPSDVPPLKLSRSGHKESKQNGRHSYSKVSEKQPSNSESFTSNDPVSSSNSSSVRTINVISEKSPSKEPDVTNNNAQIEENYDIDSSFLVNVNEPRTSDSTKPPSTPKDVSSTVEMISPNLLSPISASDSPLGALSESIHLTTMPLSPISPNITPPLEQDELEKNVTSTDLNKDGFTRSNEIDAKDASNSLPELGGNTPPGLPTNYQEPNCVQNHSNPHLPPPYHQTANDNFLAQGSDSQQPQIVNGIVENDNPPLYTSSPYKYVNNNNLFHNSPYRGRHPLPLPNQQRHNFSYDFHKYNPPPYQAKGHRGSRNMNPRHLPPPYPNRGPPNSSVGVLEHSYPQISQHHYGAAMPQISYNAYQVPPAMPNVSVPPPTYGLYPGYFGGYMFPPEMYQQQQVGAFGRAAQPPLPIDAPPMSEAPPPPPPPE